MRITVLALFLSAGSTAFGQLGPAGPLNPNPPGRLPSPWTAQGRDFGKMTPPQWEGLGALHSRTVLLPPPKQAVVPLGDAQIDPKIIHHPSPRNLGTQPAGTQIAQNLYPGLTLQPIDEPQCAPNAGPRSTTWPELKIEKIPTVWPKFKLEPIGGRARQAVDSLRK
ncbi:MAG: hypothetical protein ACLPH3_06515 [Terracidiphilus sp.]